MTVLAQGEFGGQGKALHDLRQVNFGTGTKQVAQYIYGQDRVPADQLRQHFDYLVSRTQNDPKLWDKLNVLNPELAQALDTTMSPLSADLQQAAIRVANQQPLQALGKGPGCRHAHDADRGRSDRRRAPRDTGR